MKKILIYIKEISTARVPRRGAPGYLMQLISYGSQQLSALISRSIGGQHTT